MPADDPLENPYAPPAAVAAPAPSAPGSGRESSYEAERRSVPLLVLFFVITLGIYPALWFFRRRRFLDSLDSSDKLGSLAAAPLVATVLSFGLGLLPLDRDVDRAVTLGLQAVTILVAYRVGRILKSDFARSGRLLKVSRVGLFFFNALYLQYKINQAADTAPRRTARQLTDPA